jgi:BASS family bile acid:Na+ symporter
MPDRTAQRIEFGRVGRCIVEANFDGGDLRFAANQLRILLASQHPLRAVFLLAARTLTPRTSPSALPGTSTNNGGGRPGPMLRGLFAVLVAVPAVALALTRLFDLPWFVEVGIVLMSIPPAAPVALRRSLGAGGHPAFAPSLQISVVVLAVVSMPLSIAALNHLYGGHASISPQAVAGQVFVAQLMPLGLGMTLRQFRPATADAIDPKLRRIASALLLATVALLLVNLWVPTVGAGGRVLAAIALTTVAALAVGHLPGGPEPAMRTALAISSAARNPGLALLVATQNHAPPAVVATVLAYLMVSVFTIGPYVAWRRRIAPQTRPT